MEPLVLSESQAVAALRILVTVADGAGRGPREQKLVVASGRALGLATVDLDALLPITPGEARLALPEGPARLRAVQTAILVALMDGEASAAEVARVEAFAKALDVDDPRVENLRQLAEGRLRTLWFDLARRSFARPIFEEALRERGVRGVYRIVAPMIGLGSDPDLVRRYNDLGRLPGGTLGRAYWEFVVNHELGFPGEGIVAEAGVWHDLSHVLGGYGTDPEGEVGVVSFIAGYRKDDPFFWLFTIALQFHLGVKVSPYSPGLKGHFDPELVMRAVARGMAMNRDLSVGWDYWPDMEQPLEAVRRKYGVPS